MKPAPGSPHPAFVKISATFFGAGCVPWAPGTAGSLAGLLLAWFIGPYVWAALILLTALAFYVSRPAAQLFASDDPKSFVLDEVCGVLIPALFIPKNILLYAIAFAAFRFFDIVKPWPIGRIQKIKRPWAIVADDLAAGVFSLILCYAIGYAWVRYAASAGAALQ